MYRDIQLTLHRKLGCKVRLQTSDEKGRYRSCCQMRQNASRKDDDDSSYLPSRQMTSARGPRGEYSTRREGIESVTFLHV